LSRQEVSRKQRKENSRDLIDYSFKEMTLSASDPLPVSNFVPSLAAHL
jgi:hypothetical protein